MYTTLQFSVNSDFWRKRELGDFEGMVAWRTTKGMKGVRGRPGAVVCEGIVGWDGECSIRFLLGSCLYDGRKVF